MGGPMQHARFRRGLYTIPFDGYGLTSLQSPRDSMGLQQVGPESCHANKGAIWLAPPLGSPPEQALNVREQTRFF